MLPIARGTGQDQLHPSVQPTTNPNTMLIASGQQESHSAIAKARSLARCSFKDKDVCDKKSAFSMPSAPLGGLAMTAA